MRTRMVAPPAETMRSPHIDAMRVAQPSGHHGIVTTAAVGAVPLRESASDARRPIGDAASMRSPTDTGGALFSVRTMMLESLGWK